MPTKKQNVGQENTNDKKEWYIEVENYGKVSVSKKVFTTYFNAISKEKIRRKRANACRIMGESGRLIRCPNYRICHMIGTDEDGRQLACPHMNETNTPLSLDELYQEYEIEAVDESESIVESLVREEVSDQIEIALASLNEKDRQIIRLFFWDGLNESEIAKVLKVSQPAIFKRKNKILQILREKLAHLND